VTAAPTALRVLPDGPVVPLTPGRVVPLGREASPIAHVCSDNVSRRHAEVRVEPDRLVVVDVGSVNGTFVNDRQIPTGVAHPVVAGDTLRLGSDPALRLSFTSLP
jgi:pSer/pThr/pTyr-binding forkhead associated (FHA) protein